MKHKIKLLSLLFLFSAVFCILKTNGLALASTDSIQEKWIFTQYYQCLNTGQNASTITVQESGKIADEVFASSTALMEMPSQGFFVGVTYPLPCTQIYTGDFESNSYRMPGALEYAGYNSSNITWGEDLNTGVEMLRKTGYKVEGSGGKIVVKGIETDILGKIKEPRPVLELDVSVDSSGKVSYNMGRDTDPIHFKFQGDHKLHVYGALLSCGHAGEYVEVATVDLKPTVSEMVAAIGSALHGKMLVEDVQCDLGGDGEADNVVASSFITLDFSVSDVEGMNGDKFTYVGPAETSVQELSGMSLSDLELTDDERYELYYYYFSKAVGNEVNTGSCKKDNDRNKTELVPLKTAGGKWIKKYFDFSSVDQNQQFNVLEGNAVVSKSFSDIVSWFRVKGSSAVDATESECNDIPDPITPTNGEEGITTDGDPSERCFENAGVMGHTLCPILSAVSQFTDSIYYYIENNFLMINTGEIFGNSREGGVHDAWGTIRDIANVCFVIVLLVIIFSQITGFGIDNYGIKRMLPRLIIMAVMVNISFFICQIMVDISNIAGVSIKNFMEGAIPLKASSIGNSGGAAGILGTVAAGGILVGLAFLNPGIILALITGIISAVIGLLFMFVILLARQIGVIILIILAPLAFICYMLPNTEKYFTKWRTAFLAILLAYPLCALAMGAGTMVGNIMANTGSADGNAVLLIGAMVVNVLPFFFIPMLLQNAMSALGNIGGKIAGIGQRIGRGVGSFATGAVQRSRTFNNLSSTSKQLQDEYLRKGERNMLERRVGRLSKIENRSPGQQRRLALAQSRLNAMNAEDATAEVGIAAKNYDDLLAGARSKRLQEDVSDVKSRSMQSGLVNNLTGNSNYTGSGNDFAFKEDTLESALYEAANNNDQAAMMAYVEQLSEKGHAGQEGLTQVLSKLEANGKEGAARSIAQTIMNDGKLSGQYKSGARSQYDHMKELAAGKSVTELGNIRDLSKIKAKSYSKESLANADKEELSRINAAIQQGKLSDAEVQKFRDLAQGALDDARIEGGTKLENEKLLQSMSAFQVRGSSGSGGTASGATGGSSSTPAPSTPTPSAPGSTGDAAMDAFQQAQANINAERMAQQQRQNAQNSADATGEMYENIFNNQRNS